MQGDGSPVAVLARDIGRYREIQGDTGRCREMAHRLPFLPETMRRQEPASSPSMKSVLHLEVPGHLARVGVRGWG